MHAQARSPSGIVLISFYKPLAEKYLKKNYFSIKKKGTEVYSTQGNTDSTELAVIDEPTQFRKLPRTQRKRKVLLHVWSSSVGITNRRDKHVESNNGASDVSLKRLVLAKHLSQEAKEDQDTRRRFWKALKIFEGCAERWERHADCRECMHARNHDKLEQSRKWM